MALASMRPRTVRDPLGDTFRMLRDKLERAGVRTEEHCGPRELYARSRRALPQRDARQARKLLARYESMRYSRSSEGIAAAEHPPALRRAVRTFKPVPNPEMRLSESKAACARRHAARRHGRARGRSQPGAPALHVP